MRHFERVLFIILSRSYSQPVVKLINMLPAKFGRPTLLASIVVDADKIPEKYHFLASTARAGL